LKPILGYILIKAEEKKINTDSGLIIPEEAREKERFIRGVVVEVGPGNWNNGKLIPVSVSGGDVVLFDKATNKIDIDGTEYHIAIEANILGILN